MQPDLAGQVVETLQTGLQSDKNNGGSLGHAYSALSEVVKV